MINRLVTAIATAALATALVVSGALPAVAGPGDWEEHDRVGGLINPTGLAVHDATGLLYVTEAEQGTIAVLDADTLALIGRADFSPMLPGLITVDQGSGIVYFADYAGPHIVRWNPSTPPASATSISVSDSPASLELAIVPGNPSLSTVQWTDDDGSQGWLRTAGLDLSSPTQTLLGANVLAFGIAPVVDPSGPTVLTFHTDFNSDVLVTGVVSDLSVGSGPADVEALLSSTSVLIAVANHAADTVTIFESGALTETTVAVTSEPYEIELAGPDGPVFVVAEDGFVSVIPAPYTSVGWTIDFGTAGWLGEYSAALNRLFVADSMGGAVVSIALTPAATGGGTGLADTGTDATAPVALAALALTFLGGLAFTTSRRRRGVTAEK